MHFSTPVVAVVIGVAAAAVLSGAWWLWWRLPKRQVDRLRLTVRDPKARADVEDNFRKTIGQLLGGAAVLIGAGFAYLQFTQQQETAREQLRASVQQVEQQQRAAHDLLISNQVAKGFELLGNPNNQIQQRLGGIYALEGVMNTSEQYHQPVLEALSAFVRDGTRNVTGNGPLATDVQAALTVIGRRVAIGTGRPDLANAHIPKAQLNGAHLSGAVLSGANLNDANLSGAHLNEADLRGAQLRGANLNDAHLNRTILNGANLNADLNGANLSGAHLSGVDLSGADLGNAHLNGAHLIGVDLIGANLNGAHLTRANLNGAHLNGANLSGARLIGALLNDADLISADLSNAHLNNAHLDGRHGAHLNDADLM
jgi:uncharacterized protein YjbI with pentapeptide repeats